MRTSENLFLSAFPKASLALAIGFLSVSSQAQTAKQLDKVVVSAAGYEQKITDAPASISVITTEELAKKPYVTLLDAVRELEGVDIGETRDKTGQGTISMRGMGADYTLILVDGKRQNNHGDIYPNSFGGNQFGHIPPLDTIERIEVIRGPASTLYGADAMGGVINVITKKVTDKWVGSLTHSRTLETKDAYGDDTTTDFNVMGPLIPGKLGLAVRGSVYDREASRPEYDSIIDPAGNVQTRSLGFGSGGKTVDNKNEVIGGRLSWTPTANQSIWFDIESSKQAYDNTPVTGPDGVTEYPVGTVDGLASIWSADAFGACDGASGANRRACSSNGGTWQNLGRRANPRVGYRPTQEFTRDTWSLTHEGTWDIGNSLVSLSYVDTNNEGRTMPFTVAERGQLLDMIDGNGVYADLSEDERKAIAESTFLPRPDRELSSSQYTLDAKLDMPFELAGQQHVAVVGAQVIRGELNDGVFGMESGNPGVTQEHNMYSLFAEDTWFVTEPFALTMGLRYDDHEVFGDHVSPRVYGVYTASEQWTFKGGVSTGFKTPKTTQLYNGVVGFGGQGTSPNYGNPDLQPETTTTYELAAYWQSDAGHNFNITGFVNDFEDKITPQPCGPLLTLACAAAGDYAELGYANSTKTTNIDKVTIQGIEVAGRYQLLDGWSLRGNYTLTDSEQKSGAQKGLPLGDSAKHMANFTLDWAATAKLTMFLTAEYRTDRYVGLHGVTQEPLYNKDDEQLHLGGAYKANENVTFNFRINNLLDKDYSTYRTEFNDLNNDGEYVYNSTATESEILYFDDYNNKAKARSVWLGVNVRF